MRKRVWLKRIADHFRRLIWWNPEPPRAWEYTRSTQIVQAAIGPRDVPADARRHRAGHRRAAALSADWQPAVVARVGGDPREARFTNLGGTPLNGTWRLDAGGTRCFVKVNAAARTGLLEAEADGLGELARAGAVRVPAPLAWGSARGVAYLALEWLDFGRGGRDAALQGRATGKTQISWTREYAFGKYHFLGVNTADNSGAPFSLTRPWGDYAGIDATELAFISDELARHDDADLALVFGHHPVTDTGSSDDTWLFYGHQDFIHALDIYRASLYDYGHTHDASEALFTGNSYTGLMAGGGIHYYNVASLAKSDASNFSVVAIDCNGVSSVTQTAGTWPVVLITAPIDSRIGSSANP